MSLEECIKRPLEVVQNLFKQNSAGGAQDVAQKVITAHFERVLASPTALQQVPCLTAATADKISSGTLVRFRGMIQDMLNPEYYLGAYQLPDGTWRTTQFSDQPPADLDMSRETRVWDRRPLYCTRVPSDSDWAEARWTGLPQEPQTPSAAERAGKRGRCFSEEPHTGGADAPSSANGAQQGPGRGAAAREQDQGRPLGAKQPRAGPDVAADASDARNAQEAGQQQERDQGAQEPEQPRPTSEPGDCIVYLPGEGESFKLHDVVEVVGLISVMPGLAAMQLRAAERRRQRVQQQQHGGMDVDGHDHGHEHGHDEGGIDEGGMEVWGDGELGTHPPTSQVLRLHAILARRVPPSEPPPRVPASLKPEELRASVGALRGAALRVLAAALGGDELAAEYVLAAAVGRIHKRVDGVPHGHVHVNLACPADAAATSPACGLRDALSSLLPCVRALPLTLRAVNAGGWAPHKDHESGRLARGALQLPPGALLLLDETDMGAGAIGEAGVRSLQALNRVLGQQQLSVDFQFYQADYPTDVAVVTVSRGRSLLHDAHHIVLPLAHGAAAAAAATGPALLDASELDAVRDYLAFVRSLQCQLDEAAAEQLAAAYADAARSGEGFSMDRLNTCVTLAKLLSLSAGQDRFDMSSWRRAMDLEAARRQRVAAQAQAAGAPANAQPAPLAAAAAQSEQAA